jgi:hypothetical protein
VPGCTAALSHPYSRLCAPDRLVPLRSFSLRARRAITAPSASARAVVCLHQGRAFRYRPRQASSVLHEQLTVPPDVVRCLLLNGLRRPPHAAPLPPCGSTRSRRAAAPPAPPVTSLHTDPVAA